MGVVLRGRGREASLRRAYRQRHEPPRTFGRRGGAGRDGGRALVGRLTLSLVMSHLACADEPDHPKSEAQRNIFDRLRARLPAAPGEPRQLRRHPARPRLIVYDLVRPGIALYGGHPRRHGDNPFQPVVQLKGRILQVRDASPGETVGYGATRTLREATRASRSSPSAMPTASSGRYRSPTARKASPAISVLMPRRSWAASPWTSSRST